MVISSIVSRPPNPVRAPASPTYSAGSRRDTSPEPGVAGAAGASASGTVWLAGLLWVAPCCSVTSISLEARAWLTRYPLTFLRVDASYVSATWSPWRTRTSGVGDLHRHAGGARPGRDQEAAQLHRFRRPGAPPPVTAGRRCGGVLGGAADPYHVRGATAVGEVPVDRVGQVRALGEAAELPGVLVPARDQRRRVERAVLGEPDERGDGGADPFDRSGTGLHLLHVHARGEVRRHARSFASLRVSHLCPGRVCAAAAPGGRVPGTWTGARPLPAALPPGRPGVTRLCPPAARVDLDAPSPRTVH
jgi:hypothetical protein